jgi:hypothetical protein
MTKKTLLACGATLAALGILAAGILGGCGSDDDEAAVRLSRKGEACQTSNDCGPGLSCLPLPTSSGSSSTNAGVSICVTGEFRIDTTAKECARIQCEAPADCCSTPPSNCPDLQAQCAGIDGGFGNTFACQQYDRLCKCDLAKWECNEGSCRSICTTDVDCGGGTLKCSGGRCVQCVDDLGCGVGNTCLNGVCKPPCTNESQCPLFNRCTGGKCVESGCLSKRECVAATGNVEATCGTDGQCITPCQTDLECGNPKDYSFYSCINNQCTYTGCNSDKECEFYFKNGSSSSVDAGAQTKYLCRPKKAVNPKPSF